MKPEQFYIIDAHSLFYRCYYAPFTDLTAPTGEPTKATYMFTRILIKLCRVKAPAYFAIAFDSDRRKLKRCQVYPAYKGNRKAPDEGVLIQIKRVRDLCKLLGPCCIRQAGYEADDIIASLVTQYVSDDVHATVVTQDKDLGALLVDRRVRLYDPHTESFTDYDAYHANKGCRPEHVETTLALAGDSTDNIPPIGGIGVKTACQLLEKYKSLKGVLRHQAELAPRVRSQLAKVTKDGTLERNLMLATLVRDVDLGISATDLAFDGLDIPSAKSVFEELGFRRWE